jgi:hypothetical protein
METSDPLLDPDIVCGRSPCIGQSTWYRGAGSLGIYTRMPDYVAWHFDVHHISG